MESPVDKPSVLLVEDEEHLAAGLKLNFELEGYAVDVATTGKDASRFLLRLQPYDVIILDVMLPDMNGYTLCHRLREAGNFTPVIMLTARTSSDDRIMGLDAGADDYLPKPFELSELLARVRSVMRRRLWDKNSAPDLGTSHEVVFGNASVNFDTHEVIVAGKPIKLTQIEIDLVRYFFEHTGRVISREELLEKVWKLRNYPNTRTVDNFIVRLRRHFERDAANPQYFVSVRGAGYKFVL